MQSVKIISSFPCLVVCQGQQVFLDMGQQLLLDEEKTLAVYPTTKGGISFCIDTDATEDCQFFNVFTLDECKIFYLTSGTYCEKILVSNITLNDSTCRLELGSNFLNIEYLQFKNKIFLEQNFDRYNIETHSNFVYVLLSSAQSQKLILFNGETGKVKVIDGDEIKINGTDIVSLKNYDDIARHTIQRQYSLTQDGILQRGQQIDFQSSRPVTCQIPQTIPFAFLQAVFVEDFALAMSYLDISMRRQTNEESLKAFFGKITDFFQVEDFTFATCGQDKAIFKFLIDENKIVDIDKL